jgi:hypothetical protein
MLTATNEAHSDAFFVRRDVRGGYFARTFIIYESEENRSNSLLVPLQIPIDYKKDAEYLKVLAKLQGEFRSLASRDEKEEWKEPYRDRKTNVMAYYSTAGLIYQEWYDNFKESMKVTHDPTGTLNRFGDSVLKVAMLLSLARDQLLFISEEAMVEAIEVCEKLVGNVRRTTIGKTENEGTNAVRKTLLLQELMDRDNHAISRVQINRKFWIQGNMDEWDSCIQSFEAAGIVKINTIGNQVVIQMTDESVREYAQFFKGRIK